MSLATPISLDADILDVHCDTHELYQEQATQEVVPRLVLPPADHHTRSQELRGATLFTKRGCILQFVYDDGSKLPVVIGGTRSELVDRAKIHDYLIHNTKKIAEVGLVHLKHALARRNSPLLLDGELTVDDVAIDFSVAHSLLQGQADVRLHSSPIWMLDQETISFAQDLGPGAYFQEPWAIIVNCHLDIRPVEERYNRVVKQLHPNRPARIWNLNLEVPAAPDYDEKAAQLAAASRKKVTERLGPVFRKHKPESGNSSPDAQPDSPNSGSSGPEANPEKGSQGKNKTKNWKRKQKRKQQANQGATTGDPITTDSSSPDSEKVVPEQPSLPPAKVSGSKPVQPPDAPTAARSRSLSKGRVEAVATKENVNQNKPEQPARLAGDARERIKGSTGPGFNFNQPWQGNMEQQKYGRPKPYYRGPHPYQPSRGHPAGSPSGRGDFNQFSYPPLRANYGYGRKHAFPTDYSHPDLGFY